MNPVVEGLKEREVTYGDVTFHIGKLMPFKAKAVFMAHVRPLLQGVKEVYPSGDTSLVIWQMIVAAVTGAPQNHYDALMRILYKEITYTTTEMTTPTALLGDEENAFKDLEMGHILLLDARAFVVNFFESWAVVESTLQSGPSATA